MEAPSQRTLLQTMKQDKDDQSELTTSPYRYLNLPFLFADFLKFWNFFRSFQACSDLFGPAPTFSDAFGCVRMGSWVFRYIRTYSDWEFYDRIFWNTILRESIFDGICTKAPLQLSQKQHWSASLFIARKNLLWYRGLYQDAKAWQTSGISSNTRGQLTKTFAWFVFKHCFWNANNEGYWIMK